MLDRCWSIPGAALPCSGGVGTVPGGSAGCVFSVRLTRQRPPFSRDGGKRKLFIFLSATSPGRQLKPLLHAYWWPCGHCPHACRHSVARTGPWEMQGVGSR